MSFKQIGFVTGSAVALAVGALATATPAQALQIAGDASYSNTSSFPTTLTVTNEANNGDLTGGFTDVTGILVNALTIASGSPLPSPFNANYSATPSFLSNFQYQGQNAVLNLLAGNNVVQVFASPDAFTINSALFGEIRSVVGNQLLATAAGSFIASNNALGFAATLTATPVPTPALLPGLVAMGLGVLRKRKGEATAEPVGSEA
jgi:hypothetical protein